MPRGLQKFSFLTRDKTQAPAVEAQIFNNWAAREVCPLYCKEHLFSNKKGSQEGRQGSTGESLLFNMITGVRAECQGGRQSNLLKKIVSEACWKEVSG